MCVCVYYYHIYINVDTHSPYRICGRVIQRRRNDFPTRADPRSWRVNAREDSNELLKGSSLHEKAIIPVL